MSDGPVCENASAPNLPACLQTQVHFVAERKLSLEEVVRQLNELEGIQVVKLKQELLVR